MEASQHPDVPPEVQAAADRLGVPVETLLEHLPGAGAPAPSQEQLGIQQPEGTVQPDVQAAAPEAAPVEQAPAETREQQLERELAESRQETVQVRRMAQVAEEGRVIGSSGGGVPASMATDLPNIGMIEPGIRYEYLNGLITDEQLAEKCGTLQAALLSKHEGGAI